MAFNTKEQQIIEWGVNNGKSKQEVTQALTNLRTGVIPQPKPIETPTTFERIKTGIENKGEKVRQQISAEGEFAGKNALERGVGATATAFSALSGTAYNALPDTARAALDKVGGGIGKGFNYLTDKISNSQYLQEAMSGDPENTKNLESALKIASDLGLISGEILGADQGTKALNKGTQMVGQGTKATGDVIKTGIARVVPQAEKLLPNSPEIMNRVARLKPTDANKFKDLAGKTHGEYLTETGNFGTPDKIITKETQKFAQSIADKTKALSELPGVYKNGSIQDALSMLKEKALAESSSNVKSPYLSEVLQLEKKLQDSGLTMIEAERVKSLLERNVKLGYNKINNGEKIVQATNIDDALRKWQDAQASELGFTNIKALNKQTQLSKTLINALGDQVVGQAGLNGLSLTDWVVLSGGNPTAVAGFLTKKIFSSKGVQSKVAEMLNKGEVKGQIKADLTPTPESIKRAVSPQGLDQLPAPKAGTPKSQVNVQINQPTRKTIEQGTEIVPKATPSKPVSQPQSKILSGKASTKTIQQPKTNTSSLSTLENEAKKYKSAEGFVKAQGTPVYHGSKSSDIIEKEGFKLMENRSVGAYGDGIYLSTKKGDAAGYTVKGGVVETRIPNNLKLFKGDSQKPYEVNTAKLKEEGFDGVEIVLPGGAKNIVIFDPSKIKTKSQLTDIWNKANKK